MDKKSKKGKRPAASASQSQSSSTPASSNSSSGSNAPNIDATDAIPIRCSKRRRAGTTAAATPGQQQQPVRTATMSSSSAGSNANSKKRARPASTLVENPYALRPAENLDAKKEQGLPVLPTEVVLKIVEFMPDHPEADLDNRFSEADLDNRLFLSVCLGRSAFEKLVVKGVVWVDEKWREIRKAKSERSKMIMKQTYSNVVSLFFVFATSLLFSVIGPPLMFYSPPSNRPMPSMPREKRS